MPAVSNVLPPDPVSDKSRASFHRSMVRWQDNPLKAESRPVHPVVPPESPVRHLRFRFSGHFPESFFLPCAHISSVGQSARPVRRSPGHRRAGSGNIRPSAGYFFQKNADDGYAASVPFAMPAHPVNGLKFQAECDTSADNTVLRVHLIGQVWTCIFKYDFSISES